MKTKLVLAVILTSFILFTGCSDDDDSVQTETIADLINPTFPEEQQEVMATFGEIAQAITAGAGSGANSMDMDQLISFHAYGPKFTEFNDGQAFDSAGNEANERMFFGETVDPGGVVQFAPVEGTLKIAVYGNVANLTFISDFHLMIDGNLHVVNNLITLLFVKTNTGWKMVHEHHSPSI
ncbi:nuclear transport factor 2 family protein [Lacinutrix salivirga]